MPNGTPLMPSQDLKNCIIKFAIRMYLFLSIIVMENLFSTHEKSITLHLWTSIDSVFIIHAVWEC